MGKRIKNNRIVSLVLAAIMMVSVFAVSVPQQAEAANELKFNKGKGKSTVTISDEDCTYFTEEISYIKFKPSVTGYITVKMTNASSIANASGYITLCNNKKKPIGRVNERYQTSANNSWVYTRTYGVRKGKTYYLAVNSEGGVKITANIKSASKSTANTRKKAKNLNANKKANGVIIAGENKADWYKINVKKKKKVSVNITAKTNGATVEGNYIRGIRDGIKFSFYEKKGKPWSSDAYDYACMAGPGGITFSMKNNYTGATSGIDTGIYYIKVERYTNTSSGFYTLSWKYK